MKSKKKFLLLGVGVMGALALGVGATSTFAWFQAETSAASIQKAGGVTGAITVEKPTVQISDLEATITFSVVLTDESLGLSAWGSGSDTDTLYSGILPDTVAESADATTIAANARLTAVAAGYAGYVGRYAVTAQLSDTTQSPGAGHTAAWNKAVYLARNTQKKVTFSYTGTDSSSANPHVLNTSEVFFYADNNTSGSYAKASEDTNSGSQTKSLSVAVSSLVTVDTTNETITAVSSAVTIGYLYVRLDGSQRVHTAASYTVAIDATPGDVG